MAQSVLAERSIGIMSTKTQSLIESLSVQDIMTLIPHRYPFILIDRMEDIELGQSAVGIKNVTINEWFFEGHFPGHPVMPGVLIVEAMAQTAGALVVKSLQQEALAANPDATTHKTPMVYFMSIEEAKFRRPVVPGDALRLKVTKERSHGTVWKFKGQAFVGNKIASEATFTAMIVDKKD